MSDKPRYWYAICDPEPLFHFVVRYYNGAMRSYA